MSAICTRVVLLNVAMDKKARKGKVALGKGSLQKRKK